MVSEAYAMAGQASGAQQGSGIEPIIMVVAMFAIFYFLLIRPQQKKTKQHRELVEAIKSGDKVVSAGGVHGKIVSVEETVVTLEIATGVKMTMNRSAIVEVKS